MPSTSPFPLVISHDRCLVVGAGSGIGRAVALELARLGVTVYAAGRRVNKLEQTRDLAGGGRVVPVHCDVRDQAAVDAMFRFIEADGGPVPAIVNSAANPVYSPAANLTPQAFDDAIGWSVIGGFKLLHHWGLALMNAGLTGAAVTLTSAVCARGCPGVAHSSAGKAGLESLTKTLAREWGPNGLRLNVIGVGAFPVEKSMELWADPDLGARMRDQIALGRFGRLEEIVGPILFLLSDSASYVTGHVLQVEGGTRTTNWPIPAAKISQGLNNKYDAG
ncbi:MAG: SDR family oxidoreductase [Gammaproteobacteria bacterium]